MEEKRKKVPWPLLPFWWIWQLTLLIIKLTGRLLGALLALVFLIVGFVLCVTVIGAIIGVPLIMLGIGLLIRSLF